MKQNTVNKLIIAQLVNNSPPFMKTKAPLTFSQQPAMSALGATFLNTLDLHGEQLLASHPIPIREDLPLSLS
jgi:hypothetical protein